MFYYVQTGTGAQRASYPMCTRGSYPKNKALGRVADHSPQSGAQIKNAWCYTCTLQYSFLS